MSEDTMAEDSSPRKVYTSSPAQAFLWQVRIIVGLCVLFAFGYGYGAYISHFQEVWIILVAAVWLLGAAHQSAVLHLLTRVCLATSPEGLDFFAPGYSMSTTWDNIEKVKVNAPLSLAVLHLRQNPTLHHSNALRWLVWPPALGKRKLPLYLFQQSWQGELGQDFRRYAPHLFSAEEMGQH